MNIQKRILLLMMLHCSAFVAPNYATATIIHQNNSLNSGTLTTDIFLCTTSTCSGTGILNGLSGEGSDKSITNSLTRSSPQGQGGQITGSIDGSLSESLMLDFSDTSISSSSSVEAIYDGITGIATPQYVHILGTSRIDTLFDITESSNFSLIGALDNDGSSPLGDVFFSLTKAGDLAPMIFHDLATGGTLDLAQGGFIDAGTYHLEVFAQAGFDPSGGFIVPGGVTLDPGTANSGYSFNFSLTPAQIPPPSTMPLPSTLSLFVLGLLGLIWIEDRQHSQQRQDDDGNGIEGELSGLQVNTG